MSKETPAQQAPMSVEKRSPAEWAALTGNVLDQHTHVLVGGKAGKAKTLSWQHAAAAQLHGWALHEHHAGKPIALTRAEYEGALKAATSPCPKKRRYLPHHAALSPFAPKGTDQ